MENKKNLSMDEHKVLTIMKNSCISLYEVQEVFPEKGLLLKDILIGGEYAVKEKSATRSLRKWDIYAARLLQIDGQHIMSGSVYPYHLKHKERILDDVDVQDDLEDIGEVSTEQVHKKSRYSLSSLD